MTPSRIRSVPQPFEVYRELDDYSFDAAQHLRDMVLDEATQLNNEADLPIFFTSSDVLPPLKLKRVEIISNSHIIVNNYEKYLRCQPKQLGNKLENCLDERIDYLKIDVHPNATFTSRYQDDIRFGLMFDTDGTMHNAANRAQTTLERYCRAEVAEAAPYLYLGSISYAGKPEHTLDLIDEARERLAGAVAQTSFTLGPIQFAGSIFEANQKY